jgi:hypothetical protein
LTIRADEQIIKKNQEYSKMLRNYTYVPSLPLHPIPLPAQINLTNPISPHSQRLTKSLFAQEQIEESIVVPSLLAPKVEPTEPGVGSEDEGKKRTRKRVKVDENGKPDSVAKEEKEKEKQGVSLGEVVRAGMRRLEMATHSDGT